jgi:hypothetical protein
MNWIGRCEVADNWWAVVNAVIKLRFAYNVWHFLTSWDTVSFSRRAQLHVVGWLVGLVWFGLVWLVGFVGWCVSFVCRSVVWLLIQIIELSQATS